MTLLDQPIKLDRAHFYKRNFFAWINLKVVVLEMNGTYLVYRVLLVIVAKVCKSKFKFLLYSEVITESNKNFINKVVFIIVEVHKLLEGHKIKKKYLLATYQYTY